MAELGSFSGAARDLALSKATVSKAIARLEQRLAVPLFHRTSRRLSLTESGRAALTRAQRIVAEGEAAEDEAADRAAAPRGLVRLAVPMSFGIKHVAPLVPEFLAAHPQVSLDIRFADQRTDLVGEGIDLALRIGTLEDSTLRARRLLAIRRPLVASPAYVERHGTPAHPSDLADHRAILFSHLRQPAVWRFTHPLEGDAEVSVDGPLRLDNGDAALPAICAGAGIALLPEFFVWSDLRSGRLLELLPDWAPAPSALHIVTPPGSVRPARVQVLIDFLAARFLVAPWAHALPDAAAGRSGTAG